MDNFEKVKNIVKQRYLSFNESFVRDYRNFFLSKWKDSIKAIIFYGSCLNEITKKQTSTPDFFLIPKNYRSFHKDFVHSMLNWFWTPNTYSIREPELRGKFNVISFKDFLRETSPKAKDIYNLGRLTKRTAVIYSMDEETCNSIFEGITEAYYTVAHKILFLLPSSFSLNNFIKTALSISYIGEKRVEADDKIDRLILSEESFYKSVYNCILEDLIQSGKVERTNGDFKIVDSQSLNYKIGMQKTRWFILRSRVRAKLRWPKSLFTFKGWAEVLIAKIERTKGIKIELSEKEKRYPLIYGWKYYFRLKKNKMIK